jgi:NTE family protein
MFFNERFCLDSTAENLASTRSPARGRPDRCDCVALVLQGGGALGAYQAGVYQAMHEANILPDWVSGVSIGAINAALLPETRHTGAWRSFTPFGI